MKMRLSKTLLALVAASAVCAGARSADAALALLTGGATSADLSKNPAIRQQQLICDPAGLEVTSGSLSVSFNPCLVELTGNTFGADYSGQIEVEVRNIMPSEGDVSSGLTPDLVSSRTVKPSKHHKSLSVHSNFSSEGSEGCSCGTELVPLSTFLANTDCLVETGYAQFSFNLLGGASNQISVSPGFTTEDSAGPAGADTNVLDFTYITPNNLAVASYTIYADPGGDHACNSADFLTGLNDGQSFTLSPSQIASATVSGNLSPVSAPLPPTVWSGLLTLGVVGFAGAIGRRKLARA